MSNHTYIALTIGPIYRTLDAVKTTKGIWAASYLFSNIVKQIIDKIKNETQFVIPIPDPQELKIDSNPKAGLFPDRFICLDKPGLLEIVQTAKATVIKQLAEKITEDLLKRQHSYGVSNSDLKTKHIEFLGKTPTAVEDYLNDYFLISILRITVPDKENLIFYINSYLDAAEMKQSFVQEEEHAHLTRFFENVYYNFLVREQFSDRDKKDDNSNPSIKFPSSAEIATTGAKYKLMPDCSEKQHEATCSKWFAHKKDQQNSEIEKDPKLAQIKFYEDLQGFDLFQHHKYLAVVLADGDYIGKLIAAFNKQVEIEAENRFIAFSRQLFTFAYKASQCIQKYGGLSVYAGGDDLLFFAPIVKQTTQESIFNLLNDIDDIFKNEILEHVDLKEFIEKVKVEDKVTPSMSYGMSINYYKYPLNEARQKAFEQLKRAKKGKKNTIAIHLQKHSGQSFTIEFDKSITEIQSKFNDLLQNAQQTNDKMLTSIMHKLYPLEGVLVEIGDNDMQLKNFFDNNFNEKVHKQEPNKSFLEQVRCFIHAIFSDMLKNVEENFKKEKQQLALLRVYGALRFVHFIQMPYSAFPSTKPLDSQSIS